MNQEHIERVVFTFLDQEVLEGESEDLTPETPLLEWGLLDSLAVAKLVAKLEDEFSVLIPADRLVPANLETINAISAFVQSLKG